MALKSRTIDLKNSLPDKTTACKSTLPDNHSLTQPSATDSDYFRTFLNNIKDACFEFDLHGYCTFCNEAAYQMLGYTCEEYVKLNHRQRYASKTEADKAFNIYNDVYKSGNPAKRFESEMICKDGSVIIMEMIVSPIKNERCGIVGFRGMGRNITARKKEQAELERYRNFVESVDEGCFETDLAGNVTFANEAAAHNVGCTREQFIGLNHQHYTKPKEAKNIYKLFNSVYKTGMPATLDNHEIVHKSGNLRYIDIFVSLIRDLRGKPVGFRGTSRDVTDRKQAQEALRRSQEKYRNILENMSEGYFESDIRGNIIFVNDAGCNMMGYSREELYSFRKYTKPDTQERVQKAYRYVFETGQNSKLDNYEIIHRDGTSHWHQLSISLVRDASGNKIGFCAVARDVTDQIHTHQEIQRNEERIRILFNNIPVPTFVWKVQNHTATLEEFNSAALEFTRGAIAGCTGMTANACYANLPQVPADIRQCVVSQMSVENSFWYRIKGVQDDKYVMVKYAWTPPDHVIMHVNDITAQKHAEDHLKYISVHDALTGLFNRFYLDTEIDRIKTSRLRPVSFILIDLNDLKVVNDRRGHAAGDLCIKNAATLLKQIFRPEDMVARIGGDEFLVMLPAVDEETCAQMLSQLQEHVARFNQKTDLPINLSAGFSTALTGDSIEATIAEADRRMYKEKARRKAAVKNKRRTG